MEIISHRGFWITEEEKNSEKAFRRSFESGFGTETDLRDFNGMLVISHDVPKGNEMLFEDFVKLYCEYDTSLTLALNIKSDGLQNLLFPILEKYNLKNYFIFDMSTPDLVNYINHSYQFKVFNRESEYEKDSALNNYVSGIWMDEFKENWITQQHVQQHISKRKKVCLVSPELHGREYIGRWQELKKEFSMYDNLIICTDKPTEAANYFNLD